jgi:hypothetical protein
MELTNNLLSMQKLEVYNQLPHTDHPQGWPEMCENLFPESQAISQLGELRETHGHVNNPRKDLREIPIFCRQLKGIKNRWI